MDSEGVAPGDAGHADKMAPAVKKAKQKTPEQKSALEDVFTGIHASKPVVRNSLMLSSLPNFHQRCSRGIYIAFVILQCSGSSARNYLQGTNTQMNRFEIN